MALNNEILNKLMKVKYFSLRMLLDRGYDIREESQIVDKFEEVDRMFQDPQNISLDTTTIMNRYYSFARDFYNQTNNPPRYTKFGPMHREINIFSGLTNIYSLRSDSPYIDESPARNILVWFVPEKPDEKSPKLTQISFENLLHYYLEMSKTFKELHQIKTIITISQAPWPPKLYQKFTETMGHVHFQFFSHSELMYNPTKHIFNSSYRKLLKSEIETIETTEGVSRSQFAKMIYVDALTRKMNKDKAEAPIDPNCKWYDFRLDDVIEVTRLNSVTYGNIMVEKYYLTIITNY